MGGWSKSMDMFRVPRPRRALVLAPHPDDEAVGCGGYLATLTKQGTELTAVFVTDGGLGPGGQQDEALARRRRDESQVATQVLGIRHVCRWGLPDGQLGGCELPVGSLQGLLREREIEMVLVPHMGESHPDHAAVASLPARLAAEADDGLTVMTYEIWTPLVPDCVVNVTARMADKLRAVRAYESQCRRFNLEALAMGLGRYRGAWSRRRGWRFAECFQRFTLRQYRELSHAD